MWDETFIREFVVSFGFLEGLWLGLGINPEDVVIGVLLQVINGLGYNVLLWRILLTILSIIAIAVTIYGIYYKYSLIGVAFVIIAFISGALVPYIPNAILILVFEIIAIPIISKLTTL